jgi:uncharacterized membrane protein YqjE
LGGANKFGGFMVDGSTSVSLLESARRLGTTAFDIVKARLAMLTVDLQEAAYRLGWLIIWGLIAVFFLAKDRNRLDAAA